MGEETVTGPGKMGGPSLLQGAGAFTEQSRGDEQVTAPAGHTDCPTVSEAGVG